MVNNQEATGHATPCTLTSHTPGSSLIELSVLPCSLTHAHSPTQPVSSLPSLVSPLQGPLIRQPLLEHKSRDIHFYIPVPPCMITSLGCPFRLPMNPQEGAWVPLETPLATQSGWVSPSVCFQGTPFCRGNLVHSKGKSALVSRWEHIFTEHESDSCDQHERAEGFF